MAKSARSQRSDGEVTRARILDAAGKLIAASGFADTENRAIAAKAEVDAASINYHFGSRRGLYHAVLTEAHRGLVSLDDLQRIAALDAAPNEKLRRLIEGLMGRSGARQSWHARVLARELASPSSHLQTLQQTEVRPKLLIVMTILAEITSIPVDDPVLLRCVVSVAAPCAMLLAAGQARSMVAHQILRMPREVLVEHLWSFAIGGLNAVSAAYGKDKVQKSEPGTASRG
jgi:AcrR family transcriptional regulator